MLMQGWPFLVYVTCNYNPLFLFCWEHKIFILCLFASMDVWSYVFFMCMHVDHIFVCAWMFDHRFLRILCAWILCAWIFDRIFVWCLDCMCMAFYVPGFVFLRFIMCMHFYVHASSQETCEFDHIFIMCLDVWSYVVWCACISGSGFNNKHVCLTILFVMSIYWWITSP